MSARSRAAPWWGPRRWRLAPAPKMERLEIVLLPMPEQSSIIWPDPAPEFLAPSRVPTLIELLDAFRAEFDRAIVKRLYADPARFGLKAPAGLMTDFRWRPR